MRTLIAEDDFTCRLLLKRILGEHGSCDLAVNGAEAVAAVVMALEAGTPYDLICLDVMMPELDGQKALGRIRDEEEARGILSSRGAKIIMTTALGDVDTIMRSFGGLCDAYLIKPIHKAKLLDEVRGLGLLD